MNTIGPIQTNDMHDGASQGMPLVGGIHNDHGSIVLGVIRGRRLRSQSFIKLIHNLRAKLFHAAANLDQTSLNLKQVSRRVL